MRDKNPLDRHPTRANDVVSYALFDVVAKGFLISSFFLSYMDRRILTGSRKFDESRASSYSVIPYCSFSIVGTSIMLSTTTVHVLMMVMMMMMMMMMMMRGRCSACRTE